MSHGLNFHVGDGNSHKITHNLPDVPTRLFSQHFSGRIWNMLAVEPKHWLLIEVRDDVNFQVTFSLFDYHKNGFVWKDVSVQETWWVSIAAVDDQTVLLNRFMNKGGNPDRKSLIALDATTGKFRWEREEFSFYDWNETEVFGYQTKAEPVPVTLMLSTGEGMQKSWQPQPKAQPERLIPVFYAEGTAHYETIKKFIAQTDYAITKGVEYLEFSSRMILSIYVQESEKLANYLLVFSETGRLLLTVKLGENLAGLGSETFFILSGCLFLVQNKTDLVAYRL